MILEPTMKENPASARAFRLPAESIPASATTTRSVTPCRAANADSTGISVVVSARLPSKTCISRGNPPGSTRSPTWICGSTRCSLDIPTRRRSSCWPFSKCRVVTSYRIRADVPVAANECALQALARVFR